MRFQVITLFPELIESMLEVGLLGKAREAGRIQLETLSPREFTSDKHQSVDDAPFGGGGGMVMMPGPLLASMAKLDAGAAQRGEGRARRILLTPQGRPLDQATARRLSQQPSLMLLCGRYEGVDERVRQAVDEEISLGDFVLNGGEVAAMALIEAVGRLLPEVLGNAESVVEESHSAGRLEYPHYTRPRELGDESVPEVLLSGDHGKVAQWRRRQALQRTRRRRPDLLADAGLSDWEREQMASLPEREGAHLYCALVHHPVRDRQGDTVTTAVTTLDVHDIARSAHTFALHGYYVVTPIEAQHTLVQRILEHWSQGAGLKRMPERSQALSICEPVAALDDALERIQQREGVAPRLIATSARPSGACPALRYSHVAAMVREQTQPILILFGTGHGLADSVLERCEGVLAPIEGMAGYNHLSVRSAAAIVLDRLMFR